MYRILAKFYDDLQDNDYNAFVSYYQSVFKRFGLEPKLILDMGCGTGNITVPMAEKGYDMIGLDCSEEMLEIAAEKARAAGHDILFLQQDMTDFELYGTVDAMVCALDGINYLTGDGQVSDMLGLLHYYLNPGGIFIFDINTEYKFKNILDNNSFVYDENNVYCVWNNEYDSDDKICYFDLNFFLKNPDGSYCRRDEYQEERMYTVGELKNYIKDCGLDCLGIYDNLSFEPPRENSQRLFFVVQRPQQ